MKLGWPIEKNVIFTLRGHVPRTGIDLSLRAIAPLLRQQQCLYKIAGDGFCRESYEQLSKNLNIDTKTV